MEPATLLGHLCCTDWVQFLRGIEKEGHLGKRAERTGRRGGILRLLTESAASAAFIRCRDRGKDRGSLSEHTEARGAVCESSTEWETELKRSSDEPCMHLFMIRSPTAFTESCSLCCECCSAGHLFFFPSFLFFFWENQRTPGRCELPAQVMSTVALWLKQRNVAERLGQAEGSSFQTLVPHSSISCSIHSCLPPVCISLCFCLWEGRKWQAGSQHAVVWTGSPVPTTCYGCQAILTVLMKGFKLAW